MSLDLTKLQATSLMPGLQNSGQIKGSVTLSGTLSPSPSTTYTSNTVGKIIIKLPDPSVVSIFRVSLPSANGDLATEWFPLIGVVELTDLTAEWRLILYLQSDPAGRAISFNFVNLQNNLTNLNVQLDYYAHLFSYPWAE